MRSWILASAAAAPLIFAVNSAFATDAPALPNPLVTPGAAEPAATLEVVCNGTTRGRRHVTAADKIAVLDAYNIPRSQAAYYEIDHLIPLAIGGANSIANLWPQPWAESDQKDVLEVELQQRVCHGLMSQAEAQREISDDWTEAYRLYVGGAPLAAKSYDAAPMSAETRRPSLRARFEAAGLRLARRVSRRYLLTQKAPAGRSQRANEVNRLSDES